MKVSAYRILKVWTKYAYLFSENKEDINYQGYLWKCRNKIIIMKKYKNFSMFYIYTDSRIYWWTY